MHAAAPAPPEQPKLSLRTRLWQSAPKAVRARIGAALVPLERWYNDRQCAKGLRARWADVDDRVMLGAVPYARHIDALKASGVGAVLNAMDEGAKFEAMCRARGMRVLRLPLINGDTPDAVQVQQALSFLREQLHAGDGVAKVYIHCNMGSGRSACLAFAYLRDIKGMAPEQAQKLLQRIRPQVHRDVWLRVPAAAPKPVQ